MMVFMPLVVVLIGFVHNYSLYVAAIYKPVSQSCTVAKSEKFWWATGQSNLAGTFPEDFANKSYWLFPLQVIRGNSIVIMEALDRVL